MGKQKSFAGKDEQIQDVPKPFVTKPDFFSYPKGKLRAQLLLGAKAMLKALYVLHPVLSFRPTQMKKVLGNIFDENKTTWPIQEKNRNSWVDEMVGHLNRACQDVGKTARREEKPRWVCKLLDLEDQGDQGGRRGCGGRG